eukprot:Skav232583  [mRNA]  locus=scaffold932:86775:87359:- [translate_table: standard]
MDPDQSELARQVSDLRGVVESVLSRLAVLEDRLAQAQASLEERGYPGPSHRPAGSAASVAGSNTSSYDELAGEIPALPDWALGFCHSLRGGQLSKLERALRAWECGYWARFVLEGRVSKPRPSKPVDAKNAVYIVLSAPGFTCPILCETAGDYRFVVKDFKDSVSHGFPSKGEARVYCAAAGVEFPETAFRWRA